MKKIDVVLNRGMLIPALVIAVFIILIFNAFISPMSITDSGVYGVSGGKGTYGGVYVYQANAGDTVTIKGYGWILSTQFNNGETAGITVWDGQYNRIATLKTITKGVDDTKGYFTFTAKFKVPSNTGVYDIGLSKSGREFPLGRSVSVRFEPAQKTGSLSFQKSTYYEEEPLRFTYSYSCDIGLQAALYSPHGRLWETQGILCGSGTFQFNKLNSKAPGGVWTGKLLYKGQDTGISDTFTLKHNNPTPTPTPTPPSSTPEPTVTLPVTTPTPTPQPPGDGAHSSAPLLLVGSFAIILLIVIIFVLGGRKQ